VPFREKLAKRARKAGLTLSLEVISALDAYFALLTKWNKKVSLTALEVAGPSDEALDRLLIEPVLAAKYWPGTGTSVIDVGSGGGSPAIPLKIALPDISIVMIESKTRKSAFLREVVRLLALQRTRVISARAESLVSRPELAESADVVTLRAVRLDEKTLDTVEKLLKPGGRVFLFGTATEAKAQRACRLQWEGAHSLIPALNSALLILRKPR
jgi:16S rRNA (guanine527-N7)-methyltransferase